MRTSVRALLSQIIDYAGLFPPAKLPLDAALTGYLRDRKESPQRWMLGRFVCPASVLAELMALAKGNADRALLHLAVLGQPASSGDKFLAQLRADLEAIDGFRRRWDHESAIDVFEVALPKGATIAQLQAQLPHLPDLFSQAGLTAYLELPVTPNWRTELARLSAVLRDLHETQPHGVLGLKLRCGGLTAESFPNEGQIAFFCERCRAGRLPWKATAGLHHPRRHWDAGLNVWQHGFLNVFGAGILAELLHLSEADIVSILSDRELLALRCEEDRILYRDWACTTAQIAELRGRFATTFGSCSFAEPVTDLVAMGLID
jgi:hypothetical protein